VLFAVHGGEPRSVKARVNNGEKNFILHGKSKAGRPMDERLIPYLPPMR
jgi:hypothetical protein